LIADRLAQPLALYWKHRCQQIFRLSTPAIPEMRLKRKYSFRFSVKEMVEVTVKNSAIKRYWYSIFTRREVVKEIAKELQMAEKRIYAIKLSLQNKMGGRGKLNIILSG
jgi:DNA-binding CsgD family transcriptional regulator